MKRVKLMSVALVALSMVAVISANAQPQPREPKSAEEMAKMSSDRMAKSLELTDDQASQIYEINLKYAQEREAKVEEMKAEREQKREAREQGAEPAERPQRGERGGEPRMQPGRGGDRPQGGEQVREEQKAQMKEIISVLNVDQIVEFIELQQRRGNQQPQGRQGGRRDDRRQPPHRGGEGRGHGGPQGVPQGCGQE